MGSGPTLLCYDGSDEAGDAIAAAGPLIAERDAVVVTVWEPVATWEPYDPGAILSAGVARLGSQTLGLDEIARQIADEKLERGLEHAGKAGFDARGQVAGGKTWRAICDLADELDS